MTAKYGSDLIVDLLKALGIEFAALNPGSSFRALHDSIVNYGGNKQPELIACNHEEISVAIAHGYALASGKPMVAIVHNIVGLLHASMAIFNAWCDRVPVIVMGGAGPMDVTKRRSGIDWTHTALVQGNAVREFVKWDDQPASVAGISESVLRGWRTSVTEPQGPVYLCFDVEHQEAELPDSISLPDVKRYAPPSKLYPDPRLLEEAARWLVEAEAPVIIANMTERKPATVTSLIELAELLAAPTIHMFCTHPLNLSGLEAELLPEADLIFAVDVDDLHGCLRATDIKRRGYVSIASEKTRVCHISLKEQLMRSWSADFQQLTRVDLAIAAESDAAMGLLLPMCRQLLQQEDKGRTQRRRERKVALGQKREEIRAKWRQEAGDARNDSPISLSWLAAAMWEVIKDEDWVVVNGGRLGWQWPQRLWEWRSPGRYLGFTGGGGLGYGPGAAVGAALAYRNTGKLCIDLQDDGDFLYSPQALWTAAHHKIPLLIVMNNNRAYLNSEEHAATVARQRGRPVENRYIGTVLEDPIVNLSELARSLGIYAEGPIDKPSEVKAALQRALKVIKEKKQAVLVDIITRK